MRTVTDPAQAKALTNAKLIGFLQAFIGQERSVTEAAERWKVTLNAAYYRIKQLEDLELIAVASETPRAGRNLKRYRAVSDNFFVPLGIVPEASLEEFLEATNLHFQELMLRSQVRAIRASFSGHASRRWGIHIGQDSNLELTVHLSDQHGKDPDLSDPEMPIIVDGWPQLRLDYDDARNFQRELFAFFRKYEKKRGAKKYLFHFAIAPLEEGD
jgi:Helix-turn-helix domain